LPYPLNGAIKPTKETGGSIMEFSVKEELLGRLFKFACHSEADTLLLFLDSNELEELDKDDHLKACVEKIHKRPVVPDYAVYFTRIYLLDYLQLQLELQLSYAGVAVHYPGRDKHEV